MVNLLTEYGMPALSLYLFEIPYLPLKNFLSINITKKTKLPAAIDTNRFSGDKFRFGMPGAHVLKNREGEQQILLKDIG